MPELPEVETVRRGLEPAMAGAMFADVEMRRPDLRFPLPENFVSRVKGARALALRRRAKYLLCDLSTGETLIMHLGMSGRFTVSDAKRTLKPGAFHLSNDGRSRHDHVRFVMKGAAGMQVIDYNDPRRFGFMDLAPTKAIDRSSHLEGLGPEPLDETFRQRCWPRR
ncbi:MAG: DNA-formamidopyrimidine glycosylase family protein [Parvularculaceae bacterium]